MGSIFVFFLSDCLPCPQPKPWPKVMIHNTSPVDWMFIMHNFHYSPWYASNVRLCISFFFFSNSLLSDTVSDLYPVNVCTANIQLSQEANWKFGGQVTFDPADFGWYPRCQRLELGIAAQYDQDYKIMFHIDGTHAGNETESDRDGGLDVFGPTENITGKVSYKRRPSPPSHSKWSYLVIKTMILTVTNFNNSSLEFLCLFIHF